MPIISVGEQMLPVLISRLRWSKESSYIFSDCYAVRKNKSTQSLYSISNDQAQYHSRKPLLFCPLQLSACIISFRAFHPACPHVLPVLSTWRSMLVAVSRKCFRASAPLLGQTNSFFCLFEIKTPNKSNLRPVTKCHWSHCFYNGGSRAFLTTSNTVCFVSTFAHWTVLCCKLLYMWNYEYASSWCCSCIALIATWLALECGKLRRLFTRAVQRSPKSLALRTTRREEKLSQYCTKSACIWIFGSSYARSQLNDRIH